MTTFERLLVEAVETQIPDLLAARKRARCDLAGHHGWLLRLIPTLSGADTCPKCGRPLNS